MDFYKRISAAALPYIGVIGGLLSLFNFDFKKTQLNSIYDMDLKICAKLNFKLYSEKYNLHLDLLRV